jgi:uncharacterized protein YneR
VITQPSHDGVPNKAGYELCIDDVTCWVTPQNLKNSYFKTDNLEIDNLEIDPNKSTRNHPESE